MENNRQLTGQFMIKSFNTDRGNPNDTVDMNDNLNQQIEDYLAQFSNLAEYNVSIEHIVSTDMVANYAGRQILIANIYFTKK